MIRGGAARLSLGVRDDMAIYDPRRAVGDVLTRLVRLLRRSPLMYLADSGIWTYRGDEDLKLALADVVADHQNFIDRAETILIDEEVELPQSAYPLAYTGWHDVALGFLLRRVIADLADREKDLATLVEEADLLAGQGGAAAGRTAELIREIRGEVAGHLDLLRQQQTRLAGRVASGQVAAES